jgi:hypothetical protein
MLVGHVMKDPQTDIGGRIRGGSGVLLLAILFAALSLLCYQAYQAHWTMWANDGHLGALENTSIRTRPLLRGIFTGEWVDMWWIGFEAPAASPTVSMILLTMVSPEMFLKIYAPFTMLLLGFSAWVLFRQLKFAPMACVLGGLAAGLNMHCFSNGCWGTGQWNISIAMMFLAVAAIVTDNIRQVWIKAILAGLATGMAVMEGFDSGAILSVYLGVFVLFFCWITETTRGKRISKSVWAGMVVVLSAVMIAASTISTLVGTQIQGIAEAGDTPQAKYDKATMWSLPKMESLRVIIPGLFGYRIAQYTTPPPPALAFLLSNSGDSNGESPAAIDVSSAYWGKVGEDPQITRMESSDPVVRAAAVASLDTNPDVIAAMRGNDKEVRAQIVERLEVQKQLQPRFSGNGEYAGVLVALFAVFAVLNSFPGPSCPYNRQERLLLWFWGLAALFSLVAAWGRFAFPYYWLYQLPGMDKIRNPTKFMHPFTLAWIILAGFGFEAFSRCHMQNSAGAPAAGKVPKSKNWRQKLSGFDKKYLLGLTAALGAIFAGYLIYAGYKPELTQYLTHQGFDAETAAKVAAFSVHDTAWFVFLLFISSGVVLGGLLGAWAGTRARWGWALLCCIMVFDLVRSDVPWLRYFDASHTYSMNEITRFLMDKPYEHRVVGRLSPDAGYDLPGNPDFMSAIHWWLENDFPAHDIQSLEIDQSPRSPRMDLAYLGCLTHRGNSPIAAAARLWKLTNTRYIFAAANLLPALNQLAAPGQTAFRYVKRFNLVDKPGVTVRLDAGDLFPQITDQGGDALIEYTGALPRAKLYSQWIIPPDDNDALQMLASPQWNPDQTVIVSKPTNGVPIPPSSADPNAGPGAVQIAHYAPKDIQLQASAKTPAVLLYNDRIASGWHVWVDKKPADLLRCNYIMRGVFLPAGSHTIEFKFAPSLVPLGITLAAALCGVVLLFYVCWPRSTATPAGQRVHSTSLGSFFLILILILILFGEGGAGSGLRLRLRGETQKSETPAGQPARQMP